MGVTMDSHLDSFLAERELFCSNATLATYRATLGPFVRWLADRAIDGATITGYLVSLKRKSAAPDTLHNAWRMIKTFVRWLLDEELLSRNPYTGKGRAKPPKRPRQCRVVYSEAEIVALLACVPPARKSARIRQLAKNSAQHDHQRAQALVLLLVDSAMRAGEAAGLTCGQIRRDSVVIVGKGGHQGRVYLRPATRAALLALSSDRADGDRLFLDWHDRPATVVALRGGLERLAARAGVTLPARPLHAFRHWTARRWKAAGLTEEEIQHLLRHASIETTRIYTGQETPRLDERHALASAVDSLLSQAR
jgi:site-specific recombinase XerD